MSKKSEKMPVKKGEFEQIKQNIFAAKTEKEKKMWEAILRKLENGHKKPE